MVTPFAGVWIEIRLIFRISTTDIVTPFAGVWIEIVIFPVSCDTPVVTPFAGVWIEMYLLPIFLSSLPSLPSRECGLKLDL